ncbi:alpha/beta fold hydrolase [Streptomyces tsukubensis]
MTSTRLNVRPAPAPAPGKGPAAGRGALCVLLAVVASAALAAPAATAAPAGKAAPELPGVTAATPISWGPCKAEPPMPEPGPHVACGTVRVPVDWSKPNGPATEIAVARQRATDPAKRIGVLMVNPGGPGGSGVDSALYADDPVTGYSADLRRHYDIVGFDPRGIGRSQGIVCDESIYGKIPARPRNAAEFREMRTLNARAVQSCLQGTGPLAAHMDSESVVRDMDAIRAALGERRISYLGHSYGTSLGALYSRLFPGNVRTMALDSAMDPAPDAERYLLDGSVTVNNILKKFSAACVTDPACAQPGLPPGKRLTAVIDELFARADAGTLRKPGPNGPARTKVTPDQLSELLTSLTDGTDPEHLAMYLGVLYSGTGTVNWYPGTPDPDNQLILCRDYDLRIRDYAEYKAIRERVARAAPYVRYNDQSMSYVLACQGSPLTPRPRPSQAPGALPPVLVVNATHDMATPLPGARRLARSIPTAKLVEIDIVRHVLYLTNGPKQLIDNHLTGRTN